MIMTASIQSRGQLMYIFRLQLRIQSVRDRLLRFLSLFHYSGRVSFLFIQILCFTLSYFHKKLLLTLYKVCTMRILHFGISKSVIDLAVF